MWRKSRPRVAKFRALCGEIPAKDVEKSVPIMPQSSTKFGKKSRPQMHKTRLKNKARKIATRGLDPYCAGKKTPISLRKRHGQNKALRLAQFITDQRHNDPTDFEKSLGKGEQSSTGASLACRERNRL